jgi:acetyl-CoA acetyltransferase
VARELRDVAVVGVGQSDFGALWAKRDAERDAYQLAAEAYRVALKDAGLDKAEVDGLICSRVEYLRLADVLGLRFPRFVHGLPGEGRMSGVAMQEAVAVVASGQADVVACVYGNNGRSVKMRYGGEGGGPTVAYDEMYGMTSPGAYVAMMYRRYKETFGVPDGALAPLAINNRENAQRNPVAVFKDELTVEEYMASRFIAEPMRMFDYCIINDGGVALIVTTLERARTLRKRPVRVAASAGMGDLTNYYTSEDYFDAACSDVASRVYERSGLNPQDMHCIQVYDNFLPTILFTLEGFGYAPQGEAWQAVGDGRIGLGGGLPLNTAGGHTSESYMQGWAHEVEAVRQVRGEAGDRQIPDCNAVHYMCASPIVTSHIFVGE